MYGTSRRFDTDFYSFLENILPRFLPRMRKITVYQYVLSLSTPVSCSKKATLRVAFLFGAGYGISRTYFNADVRWTSAGRRLDGGRSSVYSTPVSARNGLLRVAFLFGAGYGISRTYFNADVRWTSADRRLDRGRSSVYSTPVSLRIGKIF